ncbi:uncharacterized protein BO80DRAFT_422555 [Aspergillus ibericus CBS 121593]|uniref:Uncharacterized protein n=1 Tax=Aspergillus ibericus CBS 121593 TaxID=1448316 RepID=A0A395HD85_9EURO|nr:hypothetical protein BO80DRAFT_422555 [Aspergillus ibericus CBS 121593]RAL04194.1 hypothetical protein BO80DRAFT_422555 [Aspergillus ibericus CBS 121593]
MAIRIHSFTHPPIHPFSPRMSRDSNWTWILVLLFSHYFLPSFLLFPLSALSIHLMVGVKSVQSAFIVVSVEEIITTCLSVCLSTCLPTIYPYTNSLKSYLPICEPMFH